MFDSHHNFATFLYDGVQSISRNYLFCKLKHVLQDKYKFWKPGRKLSQFIFLIDDMDYKACDELFLACKLSTLKFVSL